MYKQLREVLGGMFDMPMKDQKIELIKLFDEWRGDEDQIDDVLIMGVRL